MQTPLCNKKKQTKGGEECRKRELAQKHFSKGAFQSASQEAATRLSLIRSKQSMRG